ncbi:MAG: heavy-metal-associated domain-containing protein [Bacteroides sp.]|nr:heavy-metal-associated domain-containing protein [Bacteroides sp.]
MLKRIIMPAIMVAIFAFGSAEAKECQTESSKTQTECCKKENHSCAKKEGCAKQEGKKVKESNDTVVAFAVEPKLVCQNCENRVKSEMRFEKGIKKIDASAADQRVTITFDRRKSDVAKLKEAFAKIGYQAETID